MRIDTEGEKVNGKNATSQIRPFSLGLYLLIVFGLSWPFQIVSAMWATDLLARYALNAVSMVMVTVGTFIAGRYVFRDGFMSAGWRWGKPKHYLAVIGLALLLWAVPTFIDLVLGTLSLPSRVTRTQIVWVFVLLFVTLIPGFGEEFGWRGYMLPHLAQDLSARKAVLAHAIIWWAWHLPLLIGTAVQAGIASAGEIGITVGLSVTITVVFVVIIGVIPAVLHGVVFAYIWSRSHSLAVATVYHAAYDGVRDSIQTTIGSGPIAGLWANALLVILGVVFLRKGKWESLEANATVSEIPAGENT
jgi:membrane protease YdiL (CAAX protease family)